MIDFAICEIAGKQYKVTPNREFTVPAREGDEISAKVLMLVEGGKAQLGEPYLKDEIKLKVVGNVAGEKIRVAKFHAKANYRKVRGHRAKLSKVVLALK